jgi:hypothetical protein
MTPRFAAMRRPDRTLLQWSHAVDLDPSPCVDRPPQIPAARARPPAGRAGKRVEVHLAPVAVVVAPVAVDT